MDEYWKIVWQCVPSDHFVSPTETYDIFHVWKDSDKISRYEKTSITRESVQTWGKGAPTRPGSSLVFSCLVLSTGEYNDFPLPISRDDLSSAAEGIGIARSHLPLLFTPYTTYTTMDRQVSWYYGLPGLRALAFTDTSENVTRAIVSSSQFIQPELEKVLQHFSGFASHPLMFAFAIRATTLADCEDQMSHNMRSLRHIEAITGFHANYSEESSSGTDSETHSEPRSLNLAQLSKMVGSNAANLGNFKIIAARLGSMIDLLYTNSDLKWQNHFDAQAAQLYRQQSDEMIEMDMIFESKKGGLLEAMVEYQNRARSLQSVIFNLIAKEDANASIDLAKESRAIAVATKNDGASMKTIAIMTMLFLPATFYAALFAVPTLQWEQSPVVQTKFWVYWAFTIPSTIFVLLSWYLLVARQVETESVDGKYNKLKKRLSGENRIIREKHGFLYNMSLRNFPYRREDHRNTAGLDHDLR